jgi:hypothetical protein
MDARFSHFHSCAASMYKFRLSRPPIDSAVNFASCLSLARGSVSGPFISPVSLANYLLHDGLKGSDAFRHWTKANMFSYFEILRGFTVIRRPMTRSVEIRIASFGEFDPITA